MRLNPEYEKAFFELVVVDEHRKVLDDPHPMRFATEKLDEALRLMQLADWGKLRSLSIPKFIP